MRFLQKLIFLIFLAGLTALLWIFIFNKVKPKNAKPEIAVSHHTVLQKVEALGKMELVKYQFSDIVELTEKNQKYLGLFEVEDSKAVLITKGEAVGCIDFRKIKMEDLQLQDSILIIKMPQPELCYHKLDLSNSRIYSVNKAVYYKNEKDLIERAYQVAEQGIKESALKSGILEKTKENAEIILRPFLEEVSGKKVHFVYTLEKEPIDTRL